MNRTASRSPRLVRRPGCLVPAPEPDQLRPGGSGIRACGAAAEQTFWNEIHLDAAVWTVSGTRMKAQRDHRAPMSEGVVEVPRAARRLGDGTRLAFPSQRGKALADRALSQLVRQQGLAAVPHGFRSSFRDWASECTNHRREGRRGGACPRRAGPDRGGLRAVEAVRAASPADGRLDALRERASTAGFLPGGSGLSRQTHRRAPGGDPGAADATAAAGHAGRWFQSITSPVMTSWS